MTFAERIRHETTERLTVMFSLAKTAMLHAQTDAARERAVEEFFLIRMELGKRGVQLTEEKP